MGVLFDVLYREYERQCDIRFAHVGGVLDVKAKRRALDTILNRIQWNGCLAYGYIFNRDLPIGYLEKTFEDRLQKFRDILDRFELHLESMEVLGMIEKLKARGLSEDEILRYELDIALTRVSQR